MRYGVEPSWYTQNIRTFQVCCGLNSILSIRCVVNVVVNQVVIHAIFTRVCGLCVRFRSHDVHWFSLLPPKKHCKHDDHSVFGLTQTLKQYPFTTFVLFLLAKQLLFAGLYKIKTPVLQLAVWSSLQAWMITKPFFLLCHNAILHFFGPCRFCLPLTVYCRILGPKNSSGVAKRLSEMLLSKHLQTWSKAGTLFQIACENLPAKRDPDTTLEDCSGVWEVLHLLVS